MSSQTDSARLNALAQIERTEKGYKMAFFGAVLVEAALLTALLLLANLRDRMQVLLLVGFVGSYSIIVLAIVALGTHVSRVGLRIIRAFESSGSRPTD